MSSPVPPSARQRILAVAGPLFFRDGYRATGVDRVIAESGVAKATFYRHFPAKDDLIVAWLEQADRWMETWLTDSIAGAAEPLIALFEALRELAGSPACFGCSFQGVSAEYPDPDHPGHRAALVAKRRVLARLEALSAEAGTDNPRVLAEQLFLLLEGTWASVRMFGAQAPVGHAVDAARILLRAGRGRRADLLPAS